MLTSLQGELLARARCQLYLDNGPMPGLRHFEGPPPELDPVAWCGGHAAERGHDQTGHSGVVALRGVAEFHANVRQVVDRKGARHNQAAVCRPFHRQDVAVGFAVDLTHKFFEQVFEGHNARHPAVLVDNDGNLFPLGLEPPKRIG